MKNIYLNLFKVLVLTLTLLLSKNTLAASCQHQAANNANYSEAVFFYPCNVQAPLPAITLTGGYTNSYRNLQWLTDALVNAGYIVLAITPNDKFGGVYEWKTAHIGGYQSLLGENDKEGSFLYQRVDAHRIGMGGFSLGGGGSLLAASELEKRIKTVLALSPFIPQEDLGYLKVTSPVLILSGQKEADNSKNTSHQLYQMAKSSDQPSLIGVYSQGKHTHWYRRGFNEYKEAYASLTIAWLDRFLKEDTQISETLTNPNLASFQLESGFSGFETTVENTSTSNVSYSN